MNIFPIQRKNHILSRPSVFLLFYGLYAILCQLSLILLHTVIYAEQVTGALLAPRFAPMLEHSLMSLTVLALGIYLVERTVIEIQSKK